MGLLTGAGQSAASPGPAGIVVGMGRDFLAAVWAPCALALFAASLCACGEAQNRPDIVETFPADGQTIQGPIDELKVTYDQPVTILNEANVRVFVNNSEIPTFAYQRPEEPTVIRIQARAGWAFPPDSLLSGQVAQGLVVNDELHYRLEPFFWNFRTSRTPGIPIATPGAVHIVDRSTYIPLETVATPPGREAVHIIHYTRTDTVNVLVQLDNGGGTGEAFGYFRPGDAVMTTVSLSTAGGGDLTAPRRNMVLDPGGIGIYAAYRDETPPGRVRLVRIDPNTGQEVRAIELASIPQGPSAAPQSVAIFRFPPDQILIACSSDEGPLLAQVEVGTMVERDFDPFTPGIQALPLPGPAGPMAAGESVQQPVVTSAVIGDPNGTAASVVNMEALTAFLGLSTVAGQTVETIRTIDGLIFIQGLANYTDRFALQARTKPAEFLDIIRREVSDDVGGAPTGATSVTAMGSYPNEDRFLILLDSDVATTWRWNTIDLFQEDRDDTVDGVQAVDVSTRIPGATVVGEVQGTFAP